MLRLYVAGGAPRSVRAIHNVKRLCEDMLGGAVDLTIVDIYQEPGIASAAQIVAAPTLVRVRPAPLTRFIGTLSDVRGVLGSLGVEAHVERGGDR